LPVGAGAMESVDLVQPVDAKAERPPHGGLFCSLLALTGHAWVRCTCLLLTQSGHRGQFRQTLAASIKVQV
ncbi:MAG: hypothetical protein WB036_21865, partial [Pseudolabrys sp.]